MEYLKEYVCEENVILVQIHYEEDTHHLQAYFLPVVNEVKKIIYELDDNTDIKQLVYETSIDRINLNK